MIVTADTCTGPKAYAGLASTYYEKITQDYQRLSDSEWAQQVYSTADVPWVQPILAP
jgi:hypothetical protein